MSMDDELKILNLYHQASNKNIHKFKDRLNSSLKVADEYDKVTGDTEWIDIMEDTIRYIDNILRNPNRFIVNEEDIVKIELARRVTVESIKHLSRNTNLIQDYDKETGDVKPSKILNINKEESFNTYENRFIYSLIQNMKGFIARKKSIGIVESSIKSHKKFEYVGSVKMGPESVDMSMEMGSNLHSATSSKDENGFSLAERIERLELKIADLTNSEVYKTIQKLHIALVTSPIKKTNVILKNVNFQYAVKLWNYMQENIDDNTVRQKENKHYEDKGDLKDYVDETFLLNYLVMNTLNKDNVSDSEKEQVSEKIINNMVQQIVSLDADMTVDDLKNIVGKTYEVVKYKQVTTAKRIEEIFSQHINKYLDKVHNLKI